LRRTGCGHPTPDHPEIFNNNILHSSPDSEIRIFAMTSACFKSDPEFPRQYNLKI
jgi:hypothetical protein